MRKKLRTDPRVTVLATRLQRSRAEIIGGLFLLWCLGDEHGENLRGLTKPLLDAEIGIPGFSDALPEDWLQERVTSKDGNAASSLHLPNYVRKNTTTERTRTLTRERVRKFRERQNEARNAVTSLHDPPDQTSPTKTRGDERLPPATKNDARLVIGYAKDVLGLELRRLVVVEEILVDFGLAVVVDVLEHFASRRPTERFKGIRSLTALIKSTLAKAQEAKLPREHDFMVTQAESFEDFKARTVKLMEAHAASLGGRR